MLPAVKAGSFFVPGVLRRVFCVRLIQMPEVGCPAVLEGDACALCFCVGCFFVRLFQMPEVGCLAVMVCGLPCVFASGVLCPAVSDVGGRELCGFGGRCLCPAFVRRVFCVRVIQMPEVGFPAILVCGLPGDLVAEIDVRGGLAGFVLPGLWRYLFFSKCW